MSGHSLYEEEVDVTPATMLDLMVFLVRTSGAPRPVCVGYQYDGELSGP